LGYFNPITIGMFLVSLAMVWHIIRSGRSGLWMLALAIVSFLPGIGFLATIGIWLAYLFTAVIPDFLNSHGMRRFKSSVKEVADPGRAYRQAKRDAERVGSADSKRTLAEESLKRGLHADAVALYESAMSGPLGEGDPTLLKGMARAKLLSGDAQASEEWFLKLKALDPKAFDTDSELDYARALEEQGKTAQAVAQYEKVAPRYSGEEARVRFALLLQKLGQDSRAQALFREAIESVQDAPSYYRSRQTEWVKIAKQNLK
jgi:hypothetical protein